MGRAGRLWGVLVLFLAGVGGGVPLGACRSPEAQGGHEGGIQRG